MLIYLKGMDYYKNLLEMNNLHLKNTTTRTESSEMSRICDKSDAPIDYQTLCLHCG